MLSCGSLDLRSRICTRSAKRTGEQNIADARSIHDRILSVYCGNLKQAKIIHYRCASFDKKLVHGMLSL